MYMRSHISKYLQLTQCKYISLYHIYVQDVRGEVTSGGDGVRVRVRNRVRVSVRAGSHNLRDPAGLK